MLEVEIKIKQISFFLKDIAKGKKIQQQWSRWCASSMTDVQLCVCTGPFSRVGLCQWQLSLGSQCQGEADRSYECLSAAGGCEPCILEACLTLPPALQTLKPSRHNIWPQSSDLKGKSHLPAAGLAWILSMTRMGPCFMLILYRTTNQCFMR